MNKVERITFSNSKKSSNFEIVSLELFFGNRPIAHLQENHRLTFWVMIYIKEGKGSHYIDFKRYDYQKGDLIIIKKNQVHRFLVNEDVSGYIMIYNEPFIFAGIGLSSTVFFDFFNRAYHSACLSIDRNNGNKNLQIIEMVFKEYSLHDCDDNIVRSLVETLILSVNKYSIDINNAPNKAAFDNFNHFLQLVDEHYSTMKSVSDYAKLMLVSSKTINLATREIVGLSAKEYITERLILEIKRYLSQGDMMIYEISDKMGFDEPSNMSKLFKKYVGISPLSFKKSLKN